MYPVVAYIVAVGGDISKEGSTSAPAFILMAVLVLAAVLYSGNGWRTAKPARALQLPYLSEALVLLPLDDWSSVTKKGLTVALQLKGQLRVVHAHADVAPEELAEIWQRNVVTPLTSAGTEVPELVHLRSADTRVLSPMAHYVLKVERDEPDRQIVVVIPQLAVRHWWQKPLHNYRCLLLKWTLYARGSQRIMIIDVPWFL